MVTLLVTFDIIRPVGFELNELSDISIFGDVKIAPVTLFSPLRKSQLVLFLDLKTHQCVFNSVILLLFMNNP